MKNAISRRIFTAFSILIIFFVVFLFFLFQNLIKEAHIDITLEEMRDKTFFVENFIESKKGNLDGDEVFFRNEINNISEITGLRVTFVDKTGRVIADSEVDNYEEMDNHLYRREIMQAGEEGTGHSIRYSHSVMTDMYYYARSYTDFYLRMAKPMHEMDRHLGQIRETMIYLGLFIIFLSFMIVLYITSTISRPIEETINFANLFAAGNYSKRITNYSETEIGQIQRTLNYMADMIVEKIDSLLFEQNKLKITIESIDDGIAVIDKEKRIVIVNRSFYTCLELSDTSATGLMYFEVIRNSNLNMKIEYSLHNSGNIRFEEEFSNGRIYDVNINPISGESTLEGILIVLRDFTEKKKIEQMKTELLGNMSHELKTPITIIKGYLETIAANINNPSLCAGFIEKAIENADRQNSIVNDIIKLNMIETSNEFMTENVSIDELLAGCVSILEHKAEKNSVRLIPDLNTPEEKRICSKFLAEEIFFNLIDNAINYNMSGGRVNIESSVEGDKLTVKIRDTGVGIPDDSIDRIFERFYRVDKSRSRETGGTGLGLSIVKHAADLLGWKVQVSSSDSGSVFTVLI